MIKNIVIFILSAIVIGTWGYLLWNNHSQETVQTQQQAQVSKVTDEKGQLQKNFDDALVRLDSMTGTNNKLTADRDSELIRNNALTKELVYQKEFNKAYLSDNPVSFSVLKNLHYFTNCPKAIPAKPSVGTIRIIATAKADAQIAINEFFCGNKEFCNSDNCGFKTPNDEGKLWTWNEDVAVDETDSTLPFKLYVDNLNTLQNITTFTITVTGPDGKVITNYPEKDDPENKIHFTNLRIKALGGVLHLKKP